MGNKAKADRHLYAADVATLSRLHRRIQFDEARTEQSKTRLGKALLIVIQELQSEMLPGKG